MPRQIITDWDEVPIVLDLPYVIRILGYGQAKVYKLVKSGELPTAPRVKGGSIRITKDDLRNYIENIKDPK